jgi:hypothetical protein
VVVDEAHCVIEAGLVYRRDFLRLHLLAEVSASLGFMRLTWLLLTATAPPSMVLAISRILQIDDEEPFIHRGETVRKNMRYRIVPTLGAADKRSRICELVCACQSDGSDGLVYHTSIADVERLATSLRNALANKDAMELQEDASRPRSVEAYHAKLDMEQRRTIEGWLSEKQLPVAVATIALGMGMHFKDLRFVLHAALPKSIAALYQEASRAGRDGVSRSEHTLFVSLTDVIDLMEWSHGDYASHASGQEYAFGLCIDLIDYLLDTSTCRHVQLERVLGGGKLAADQWCCGDSWVCDNCTHMREGGALALGDVTLGVHQWGPTLLRIVEDCRRNAGGGPAALRTVASRWLREANGPSPKWVRAPLLLYSLRYKALPVSFVEASQPATTDASIDASGRRRWRAFAVADHQLLLNTRRSELASITLSKERWDSGQWGASEFEELANEIAFANLPDD